MGSNLSKERAEEMIKTFEKRSKYPDQININQIFVDFLNPQIGEYLLDVGSGSGVVSRLVSSKLIPEGKLLGIEISEEIINCAYKLLPEGEIKKIITYDVANAEDLPYTNGQFDGAFATRLLLHVSNPQKVISELKRVVRSGGRVALMDWDFGTLAIDHSNREITRNILNWRTDHKDGNNWSGRELFRRMKIEGFKNITIKPEVSIATDENNSLTHSIFHAASGACKSKIISSEEYEVWMDEINARLKLGYFFASITYFLIKGIC
ncbi:MAG: hypothetical protein BAJALOKI1v1_340003 [Promethearchaeota archaeon]|nr:MAG: hypothetical protein BAJALOKI1v1_340003 [Candidatus Lokiarchaeota archaeon]